MGSIKSLGSFAGKLAGGVIGGAVEIVGEVTKSEFIKDVGRTVYNASARSGELLGNLAEGAVDSVAGVITENESLKNKGKDQFINATSDTIKGVANGVVYVAKKGIDTTEAILNGDKEKAIELGKDLVKVVAVSALTISVIDVLDGVIDGVDGADHVAIDTHHDIHAADDVPMLDNAGIHHVDPYWRTLPDGREIWVDGDGNTNIDTGTGWIQHNPDFREI